MFVPRFSPPIHGKAPNLLGNAINFGFYCVSLFFKGIFTLTKVLLDLVQTGSEHCLEKTRGVSGPR